MNYSDYDSDGYSSNEDKDYVPSEDNLSEDDMNECVKEDGLEGDEDQARQPIDATRRKKKKTKGADLGMRKRKKGGLRLEEDKEKDGETEEKREEPLEEEAGLLVGRADPAVKEEVQKKKADDLWASFLSDVGSKPKPPTPSTRPQAEPSSGTQSPSAVTSSTPRPSAPSPSQPARVTITKVFDFAGEEVRVTKEVSSQSKEAKSYLKEQEQEEKAEEPSPAACKPLGPGPSAKRPVGMGSILNRLGGKKAKMSTLEKSKMDWDTFKSEEGITEELAIHNRGKEGYVERKNFLERVDHRQFELEKKVRLNNMKR